MGTNAKIDTKKLVAICRAFIAENDIHCVETIYQTDRVIEHAYKFIRQVCDIVGYAELNDEEED